MVIEVGGNQNIYVLVARGRENVRKEGNTLCLGSSFFIQINLKIKDCLGL